MALEGRIKYIEPITPSRGCAVCMMKIPISINARRVARLFAFGAARLLPQNGIALGIMQKFNPAVAHLSLSGPLEVSWCKQTSYFMQFRSIPAALLAYSIVIPRRSDTDEFHRHPSVGSREHCNHGWNALVPRMPTTIILPNLRSCLIHATFVLGKVFLPREGSI